jgi:hypothetical protein
MPFRPESNGLASGTAVALPADQPMARMLDDLARHVGEFGPERWVSPVRGENR